MTMQITAALIGVLLAGSILYLVRRDHLHGPYALWRRICRSWRERSMSSCSRRIRMRERPTMIGSAGG